MILLASTVCIGSYIEWRKFHPHTNIYSYVYEHVYVRSHGKIFIQWSLANTTVAQTKSVSAPWSSDTQTSKHLNGKAACCVSATILSSYSDDQLDCLHVSMGKRYRERRRQNIQKMLHLADTGIMLVYAFWTHHHSMSLSILLSFCIRSLDSIISSISLSLLFPVLALLVSFGPFLLVPSFHFNTHTSFILLYFLIAFLLVHHIFFHVFFFLSYVHIVFVFLILWKFFFTPKPFLSYDFMDIFTYSFLSFLPHFFSTFI